VSAGRFWLVAVPTLWLAGAVQQALAPRMAVYGSPPDFPLTALAALALLGERKAGTLVGFAAGAIRGVLAGANLAVYAVGRTLLGFALGWVRFAGLVPNAPVAGISAFAGTILAQGLVLLLAHRGPVIPFLTGTLFSATINGALAMPLYALLRRLIDPKDDR
jgi:cell shape-determining protein MreD